MTATDLYQSVIDEIDLRIASIGSGAPATSREHGAWTQVEIDDYLATLRQQRGMVSEHWNHRARVVAPDEPVIADVCGQAQPCEHVVQVAHDLGIATR